MTFLVEIEAVLMKRILYRFGVTTPRGRHSQSDAVLLKYIHGRYCDVEIYKGHAVLQEYTYMGDALLLKNI